MQEFDTLQEKHKHHTVPHTVTSLSWLPNYNEHWNVTELDTNDWKETYQRDQRMSTWEACYKLQRKTMPNIACCVFEDVRHPSVSLSVICIPRHGHCQHCLSLALSVIALSDICIVCHCQHCLSLSFISLLALSVFALSVICIVSHLHCLTMVLSNIGIAWHLYCLTLYVMVNHRGSSSLLSTLFVIWAGQTASTNCKHSCHY